MSEKEIVSVREFRSFGNDPGVDVQIDAWSQKYPRVTILDVKYQVAPYVEDDMLHFATFALVLFHEPETSPEISRASTQQMQAPSRRSRR